MTKGLLGWWVAGFVALAGAGLPHAAQAYNVICGSGVCDKWGSNVQGTGASVT